MSEDAKTIKDITENMGNPPKCCKHGKVDTWNDNISRANAACVDMNANGAVLADKCQTEEDPMDCGSITSKRVKKCSKWKCWLAFLFVILGFLTLGVVGMILTAALYGTVSFNFKDLGGKVDAMVSWVASGGDDSQQGDGTEN